jgi:hypothetical protein
MAKKALLAQRERELLRRYLIWCYKTTKEELDRIERYFTQLKVDGFVLEQLRKGSDYKKALEPSEGYHKLVDDFEKYMCTKKENVVKRKFTDASCRAVTAEYLYLSNRFCAIEKAIERFLGKKEVAVICRSYEEEMTRRILCARENT